MEETTTSARTDQSAETNEITEALAKAQGVFSSVHKAKTADAGSFSYSYADLSDIISMLRKPLAENGLAISHSTASGPHGLELTTKLLHSSGQWLSTALPVGGDTPQSLGSDLSYMRRYGISMVCGVAVSDDDDGAARTAEIEDYSLPAAAPPKPKAAPKPKPTTARAIKAASAPPKRVSTGGRTISEGQASMTFARMNQRCRQLGREDFSRDQINDFIHQALIESSLRNNLPEYDHLRDLPMSLFDSLLAVIETFTPPGHETFTPPGQG